MSSLLWLFLAVPMANAIIDVSYQNSTDWRNLFNGTVMVGPQGYLDQPYCIVNAAFHNEILCIVTAGDKHEGGAGEHMESVTSADGGHTWSKPLRLEPNTTLDNSYGVPVVTSTGRVYAMYNMNLHNVTHLNGKYISRRDMIGVFVMRYTDNNGKTWSGRRYVVPYRQTPIDKGNSFGGKVDIMWSVDQVKRFPSPTTSGGGGRGGGGDSIIYGFTKVQKYLLSPPEEVWFITSPNLLTEQDPNKIVWEMIPAGEHGLKPPGNKVSVGEEPHILPMLQQGGFYCDYRTTQGYLAESHTADKTAKAGWSPPGWAKYWRNTKTGFDTPAGDSPNTGVLKNPRGPTTLKNLSPYGILLLFYFNSEHSYTHSRNPYWLTHAIEKNGTLYFAQPEIVLYDRLNPADRPGYPDMFTVPGQQGMIITETQKTTARAHFVPHDFLSKLSSQSTINHLTTEGTIAHWTSSSVKSVPIPKNMNLTSKKYHPGVGLTINFGVKNHKAAKVGAVLLTTDNTSSSGSLRGFRVVVANKDGQLKVEVGDGSSTLTATMDPLCSAAINDATTHFVGLVVDAAARITTWFVDGMLCDGGPKQARGWAFFNTDFGDVMNASPSLLLAPSYGPNAVLLWGRVYNRALMASEVVGNYRFMH